MGCRTTCSRGGPGDLVDRQPRRRRGRTSPLDRIRRRHSRGCPVSRPRRRRLSKRPYARRFPARRRRRNSGQLGMKILIGALLAATAIPLARWLLINWWVLLTLALAAAGFGGVWLYRKAEHARWDRTRVNALRFNHPQIDALHHRDFEYAVRDPPTPRRMLQRPAGRRGRRQRGRRHRDRPVRTGMGHPVQTPAQRHQRLGDRHPRPPARQRHRPPASRCRRRRRRHQRPLLLPVPRTRRRPAHAPGRPPRPRPVGGRHPTALGPAAEDPPTTEARHLIVGRERVKGQPVESRAD